MKKYEKYIGKVVMISDEVMNGVAEFIEETSEGILIHWIETSAFDSSVVYSKDMYTKPCLIEYNSIMEISLSDETWSQEKILKTRQEALEYDQLIFDKFGECSVIAEAIENEEEII